MHIAEVWYEKTIDRVDRLVYSSPYKELWTWVNHKNEVGESGSNTSKIQTKDDEEFLATDSDDDHFVDEVMSEEIKQTKASMKNSKVLAPSWVPLEFSKKMKTELFVYIIT